MKKYKQGQRDRFSTSSRYIYHKVISELKTEVTQNYLSYFWWILEPCLMIGVFYVVFAKLFNQGGEGFISFLLLGVTAWLWFAHTVMRASQSIWVEMGLMLQVYVPKSVFPLAAVLFGFFKHLFVMFVLFGLLLLLETPSANWVYFILVFLTQFVLILGVSVSIAAVVPFIPDLLKVIPPLMNMAMFLSGLFYNATIIPSRFVEYFRYNPMAGLIMEYRKVILYEQQPDFVYLGKVSLYSIILLLFGLWMLKKFDQTYPRLTS